MSELVSQVMDVSQVPPQGCLNLDHVASFVPDREACHRALADLGFAPAPFSLQYHRLTPGGDLVPAGSGNHCVMLREGYLEYLVPVADTPVAAQLRASIARYVGVHSIVFGTSAAHADRERLDAGGFEPLTPIALQRDIDTPSGRRTARFTVVRVPPGIMPEGRIQFCQHHEESLVWQDRWIEHPNRAVALRSVFVCVADACEAANRYARFTGVKPMQVSIGVWSLTLQRGRVEFFEPDAYFRQFGVAPPTLPWIAGCEVASKDRAAARAEWTRSGLDHEVLPDGRIVVRAPASIGGVLVFTGY